MYGQNNRQTIGQSVSSNSRQGKEALRALIRQQIDEKIKIYGITDMSEEVRSHLLQEIKQEIIDGKVKLDKRKQLNLGSDQKTSKLILEI